MIKNLSSNSLEHAYYPNRLTTSKYTLLTFLPLAIFNQLSKPSNLFFFITLILLSIKSMSPFEPWDYLVSFSIVVGTSILKDGIEDYQRHVEDEEINKAKIDLVDCDSDEPLISKTTVEQLKEGDIIMISKDQFIPADVVLVKAYERTLSEKDKCGYNCIDYAYIETSNLDGETNLKKKEAIYSYLESKENHNKGNFPNSNIVTCDCVNRFIKSANSVRVIDTGDSFTDFDCKIGFNSNILEKSNNTDNSNILEKSDNTDNTDNSNILENSNNTDNTDNSNNTVIEALAKNVFLKGSSLRKTTYALCLVISVGGNTKQAKSNKTEKRGLSNFQKEINKTLRIIFKLYALLLTITTLYGLYYKKYKAIKPLSDITLMSVTQIIVTNYILFTFLVPLSLFLMIEICKVIHAYRINNDIEMSVNSKDLIGDIGDDLLEDNGTPQSNIEEEGGEESIIYSRCRNTDVIEDLGSIDYILTDKTGTITQNLMEFKLIHTLRESQLKLSNYFPRIVDRMKEEKSVDMIEKEDFYFLLGMILCNSIEVFNGKYEGISQEELSILEELRKYGFILIKRGNDFADFEILGNIHRAKILGELEFTSSRQRQTVIVEVFDKIILFTKGSDQKLLKDKAGDKEDVILSGDKKVLKYLDTVNEYRTMVYKYLIIKDYKHMSEGDDCKGNNDTLDRDNMDRDNYGKGIVDNDESDIGDNNIGESDLGDNDSYNNDIEIELDSDSNNSTDIPNINNSTNSTDINNSTNINNTTSTNNTTPTSINIKEFLKNIADDNKIENAIEKLEINGFYSGTVLIEDKLVDNIYSTMCLLRDSAIKLWMVTGDKRETALACAINSGLALSNNYILMEGKQIVRIFKESSYTVFNSSNLARIFSVDSLIIYRATPSQKGAIAEALKSRNLQTLAVGDGNNDVAMLKKSNVGVGILGKEGRQAVLNADFAIPSFSCLRRLILYHGRYNIIRYSKIITNSFYRNIFFICTQFLYNFYSGGSGLPVFNATFMNFFNLIYTAAIPMTIGIFDRDLPIFKKSSSIYWESSYQIAVSQEYDYNNVTSYRRARIYFNSYIMKFFIITALLQSTAVFFILRLSMAQGIADNSGRLLQISGSRFVYSLVIFAIVLHSQYRSISFVTKFSHLAVAISIFLATFLTLGLNGFNFFSINIFASDIVYKIIRCPIFYVLLTAGLIFGYCTENIVEIQLNNILDKMEKSVLVSKTTKGK